MNTKRKNKFLDDKLLEILNNDITETKIKYHRVAKKTKTLGISADITILVPPLPAKDSPSFAVSYDQK